MAAAAWQQAPAPSPAPRIPEQPIPYSHKKHLALGLECKTCHTNPDPGEEMGIPQAATCLKCHATVKKDSPQIAKLHGAQAIKWIRVYQIPSYVYFSHRVHAKASCESCHGPVREREALWKEGDLSMGACMVCHQQQKASNDCNVCHEPR